MKIKALLLFQVRCLLHIDKNSDDGNDVDMNDSLNTINSSVNTTNTKLDMNNNLLDSINSTNT